MLAKPGSITWGNWARVRASVRAQGALFAAGWLVVAALPAGAKTPGAVHCYGGACHRVATIDEMDGMVGRRGFLTASYYDHCARDRFNPCGLTSSGAVFRADLPDNAASPIFPDGTVLLVYNHETRQAVVVRVTSAGPYWGERKLDLSRAAAERLGIIERGTASLEITVLKSPEPEEARYLKRRIYAPVPGYLGRFDHFEAAQDAAINGMRLETPSIQIAAIEPEVVFPDLPQFEIGPRRFPADAEISAELHADTRAEPMRAAPVAEILTDTKPGAGIAVQMLAEENLAPSLLDRLASFVETARVKAKLGTLTAAEDRPAVERLAPPRGFVARVREFVRTAQAKARLRPERRLEVLAAR